MTDDAATSVGVASAPAFPQARTCPYAPPQDYVRLAERGPLNKVTLYDGKQVWLVTGYSQARRLLADDRLSADRTNPDYPIVAPRFKANHARKVVLLGMDAPEHDVHRRLLNTDFSLKRALTMRPHVEKVVGGLLDKMIEKGPPADLFQDFALQVPSLVLADLLGLAPEDGEFFQDITCRLMQASDEAALQKAGGELQQYLVQVAETQEREPGPGLVGRLAGHVADGGLSRAELVQMLFVLLVAGHETTASTIALGTLTLLEHPEQFALLRADPDLAAGAVEELLRFVAVTDTAGIRVATGDIEIDGYEIRSGDGVLLSASVGNRDPEVHLDPAEFDILRTGRKHLAFGHGIHQCIGQHLARVELEVVFRALFERIPGLRLAIPVDQVRMRGVETGPVQSVTSLPITW